MGKLSVGVPYKTFGFALLILNNQKQLVLYPF